MSLVRGSRLGAGAGSHLGALWWEERWLFEYWAHAAALALTEDYPIHRVSMDGYPPKNLSLTKVWMEANEGLLRTSSPGSPKAPRCPPTPSRTARSWSGPPAAGPPAATSSGC